MVHMWYRGGSSGMVYMWYRVWPGMVHMWYRGGSSGMVQCGTGCGSSDVCVVVGPNGLQNSTILTGHVDL